MFGVRCSMFSAIADARPAERFRIVRGLLLVRRARTAFPPGQETRASQGQKSERAGFRNLTRGDAVTKVSPGKVHQSEAVYRSTIHDETRPAILGPASVIEPKPDEADARVKPLFVGIAEAEGQHCLSGWKHSSAICEKRTGAYSLSKTQLRSIRLTTSGKPGNRWQVSVYEESNRRT